MQSKTTRLLIAASTLTSILAGVSFGGYALNAQATAVESPSSASQDSAVNNPSCCDNATHKVTFVAVEPGVQLEVLDWGGAGEAFVVGVAASRRTPHATWV